MKLLIAIDGSTHATHAIEVAAGLAKAVSGAEVVLVNVSEGQRYYGEFGPFDAESIRRAERDHQDRLLESAAADARRYGLSAVSTVAAHGAAPEEIVRIAEQRGVDQIVMGTRGRSAIGGLLLGSVAQRVVHLAKVPVLLVK